MEIVRMKIKRFNENVELGKPGEFIPTMDEVKEIFAHLFDRDDIEYDMSQNWISWGGSEYHVTQEKDFYSELPIISVRVSLDTKESIRIYLDYGVDSAAINIKDIEKVDEIIKEIIDAGKHLESNGYDLHLEVHNFIFNITISSKGSLN